MHLKYYPIMLFTLIPMFGYSQTGIIKGHLVNFKKNKSFIHVLLNKNITHSVSYFDSTIINTPPSRRLNKASNVTVDTQGNFRIDSLTPGWAELSFYTIGYPDYYNIYTLVVSNNDSIVLKIDYPRKNNRSTNKTCPICHKRNETIPIVNSLMYSSVSKKLRQEKIQVGGYLGTLDSPSWFCKRDNLHY